MRGWVEGLCRLMLRVFFRRVDVVGQERVPTDGPLLIVGNHPNGLMDPLMMLSMAPRPVSFLAKAPLFRTPLISVFVRALDCLPVYRAKDGADTGQNRKTMEAARALLGRGGTIGIFPEGISHDEPELQPLKTGAARMALATQALIDGAGEGAPLRIQPVGLYYEDKAIFRSEAAIVWGTPMEVPVVPIDGKAEPERADVHALTDAVFGQLRGLTPNAPDAHVVAMAARTARMLATLEWQEGEHSKLPGLGDRAAIMQRLLAGHDRAQGEVPGRLQQVMDLIERHERDLAYWGLSPDAPASALHGSVRAGLLRNMLSLGLLALPALIGAVNNYPAYRLIGWVSGRYSGGHADVVSTAKTAGGLVLFPVSWLLLAGVLGMQLGWGWAGLALLAAPLCAWAALHFMEHVDALASAARALSLMSRGQDRLAALDDERRHIREALLALEAALPESG